MLRWFSGILLVILSSAALAAVKGEEVAYQVGDVAMKGYLAYDDAVKGKRPGAFSWYTNGGAINDYARKRARMLAEMGYTALAVDMYGSGKTADHPDHAKHFMQTLTGDAKGMRASLSMQRLRRSPSTKRRTGNALPRSDTAWAGSLCLR